MKQSYTPVKQQVTDLTEHVPTKEPATFMSMIERALTDKNFDADKLDKLINANERIMGKQAEIEFNEAVARVTEKMPRITKNKSVGYDIEKGRPEKGQKEAFKYAPLEDIDKIVSPLLKEEKLSVSYDTETREGGGVIVTGTLTHIRGHFRKASIPLPLDSSGGKNNVQGIGSTFSYGRRYTLCMLLNIVVIGEDDDAQGGTITDEQSIEIMGLLQETGMDVVRFLKSVKATTVDEIKTRDYARALNSIQAFAYRKEQEAKKKGEGNAKIS